MALARCDHCGVEEYMPYVCKFCGGRHCAHHRLPENHGCGGLDEYRDRVRAEGRMVQPEGDALAAQVSTGARLSSMFDGLFRRIDGKAAMWFLGIFVGVFLVQQILVLTNSFALMDFLFILDRSFYLKPWTILTSVFAHGGFNHLLVNALVFFFFAPQVERLIGTRRFVFLFLLGGAFAGLLQLFVFNYAAVEFGWVDAARGARLRDSGILGASGGLLAIMGALTILAPSLTVLVFFVIPAPLWLLTSLYALADIFGVINPEGSGIAHLAHLGGLAFGLWYGRRLMQQGLRVHVNRPSPNPRRPF